MQEHDDSIASLTTFFADAIAFASRKGGGGMGMGFTMQQDDPGT